MRKLEIATELIEHTFSEYNFPDWFFLLLATNRSNQRLQIIHQRIESTTDINNSLKPSAKLHKKSQLELTYIECAVGLEESSKHFFFKAFARRIDNTQRAFVKLVSKDHRCCVPHK
jgi:hypothetical protein